MQDTATIESPPKEPNVAEPFIPPLENGAHLSACEFLRRFEAMPELKKAELIQGWLCNYAIATPGVKAAANSTVRLGPDDVPQPDAFLRILPDHGGRTIIDDKGYLNGALELVVEIAASSASIDTREKLVSYRRAGAQEYLVWRTEDGEVDWWTLEDDEYRRLPCDEAGVIHSRVFPGLRLNPAARLTGDGARLMDSLQEGLRSEKHGEFARGLSDNAASSA